MAQSQKSSVPGHTAVWGPRSHVGVLASVLLHGGPGSFTEHKVMNFFFFPEWTHPPPSGSTRRPRSSGRCAHQTRCHSGRHHPGKAASSCLCPCGLALSDPRPRACSSSCLAPASLPHQGWPVHRALRPQGLSSPFFSATSQGGGGGWRHRSQ